MRLVEVFVVGIVAVQTFGCTSITRHDLAHYPFPEAQAELRRALRELIEYAETADVVGSRNAHLESEKFTKFSTRRYERQDFEECIASETINLTSVEDFKYEARDLKIDVFGEVAVLTYYPHYSFTRDDQVVHKSGRQTLVYLSTADGWKIVHEHHSSMGPSAGTDDQYFDSAGIRIRFTDQGPRDAEPIILVHGAAQSIDSAGGMTGVIAALAETHRVIALDCRGHGKSDKPHAPQAYGNEMVNDVIRLLDHLEIEKAHIVGYSMGGRIVCKLVADHPKRLLSAMPSGTNVEPPSDPADPSLERLVESLEESGSIRPAIEHFNANGSMTEEQIDEIVATVRATNDTRALAAALRSMPELLPNRAMLEANAVPCLSIVGERDPNRQLIEKTAEYMANLDVHVLTEADHMTTFRDPRFIAAIRSFVGQHSSTPR